jgi:phage terminase small subunit
MARGRKPTAARLKLLKSTVRRPSKPKARGGAVPIGPVARPDFLTGRPAAIWDEYAPQLVGANLLTALDVPLFSVWCQLAAEAETGDIATPRLVQFRGISASFGLEPSARARIGPAPAVAKADPAESYFADNVLPLRK